MGARLATRARLAFQSLKSDRARLVLQNMALTAMDNDGEPAFFGGSEFLALCLGFSEPRGPAAQRAVGRAIRELRDAGLIVMDEKRARSWKRRYVLRLPGPQP